MGIRGPAPKPSGIRVLEGNPAKRALPADEPKPLGCAPDMPRYLDSEARREWKRLVPILLAMRVLTEADGVALGNLCQAISILGRAHKDMRKATKAGSSGLLMKTPSGYIQQSPLIGIINGPSGGHQPDLARIRANSVVAHAAVGSALSRRWMPWRLSCVAEYRPEKCAYCAAETWCEIRRNGKPQCRACKIERFFSEILYPPLGYTLMGWQRKVLRELYGTVRPEDGKRRYRAGYVSVAKKNGKSFLIGGLPIYHLLMEGERNPEVYGAAAARGPSRDCLPFVAAIDQRQPGSAGQA
jgi:phage terminase small subunit